MPYFQTSQEWLQQSSLLLKAYPATTRITTRYSILPPDSKTNKMRKRDSRDAEASTQDTEASQQVPTAKAGLTLKTYEPRSGVCLKYRTDKAAEVGRLVAILGRLGKNMAALPDEPEDGAGGDVVAHEAATGTSAPVVESQQVKPAAADAKSGHAGGGGSGGGKKKKKGKK